MRRLLGLAACAVVLCAPRSASAGSHAESDSIVDGVQVHQEITAWGRDTMHYWIKVRHAERVPSFCMTFQFERKTASGWRRTGGKEGRDRGCCPNPEEPCGSTDQRAAWDLFLYPDRALRDDLEAGHVRMRGFTDLGPSLVLRLNGPPS